MEEKEVAPVMTVRDAGRKGGESTSRKHGRGFYKEIGRKGGRTVSERYGHKHFQAIGQKGGRKVAELVNRAKQEIGGE